MKLIKLLLVLAALALVAAPAQAISRSRALSNARWQQAWSCNHYQIFTFRGLPASPWICHSAYVPAPNCWLQPRYQWYSIGQYACGGRWEQYNIVEHYSRSCYVRTRWTATNHRTKYTVSNCFNFTLSAVKRPSRSTSP